MHSRVPTSRTVNSSKAKKTARLDVEEDERVRRYLGPAGRRTENVRVTSWADPKSALSEHEPGMEDGGGVEGNQPQSRPHERGHTRGDSLLGGELYDEPMSMDEYVEPHNAQPSLVRFVHALYGSIVLAIANSSIQKTLVSQSSVDQR